MIRLPSFSQKGQRGAALAVALILLVVITLLSLSGMRFTTLDNRMAMNQELRVESLQMSQALLDSVVATDSNIVVFGNTGYSNCTARVVGCNQYTLQLPDFRWAPMLENGEMRARVVMTGDGEAPPRLSARLGSSLPKLRASSFEVTADYDRVSQGESRNEVGQGMILIYGRAQ
jgi:hypothetical protein